MSLIPFSTLCSDVYSLFTDFWYELSVNIADNSIWTIDNPLYINEKYLLIPNLSNRTFILLSRAISVPELMKLFEVDY